MKKVLAMTLVLCAAVAAQAQSPFFREVSYRGAFAPGPAPMWTDGWVNYDPANTAYASPTVTVTGAISSNTTWTANNVYLLSGVVSIDTLVTLTIEPGTVIRGDASVANSCLIVRRGAQLIAQGTPLKPIVFTSSKGAGSRALGDWGGVIVLGRDSINRPGNTAVVEGLAASPLSTYGGGTATNNNDNSGVFSYIRIEWGGYVFSTDNEINGITFGGVGPATKIDHIQVSYNNDDAFEWFGGSCSAKYLVAYRNLDDDFDTDIGWDGCVQFALAVRDPAIADQGSGSTSEGFEGDGDPTGIKGVVPITQGIFSNVTIIGPYRGSTANTIDAKFRRAVRLRRNSYLSIFNSYFSDFPTGVHMDGAAVQDNYTSDSLRFKNNFIAGFLTGQAAQTPIGSGTGTPTATYTKLFTTDNNDTSASTSGILVNPYNFLTPDYRPTSTSPLLSDANFTDTKLTGKVVPRIAGKPFIREVGYRGAFAPAPAQQWTTGWTNFEPENTVYPAPTVTVSGAISSNTTWTSGNTYLISGIVSIDTLVTLTIEPGTIIRGDASVANSALIIRRGAKIIAQGTPTNPIVFTSSKAVGSRALGDWGGVIMLGRANINRPGNTASVEGLAVSPLSTYGGGATPDDNDSSGVFSYCRIEFGGYVFSTDNEINGLTMGAIGRKTKIDHVQVSYNNDDAFEWFGGTVNCSHLVAFRNLDDDFDTDIGYSGSVQFGLAVRDPAIADQSSGSTSEGFEGDGDPTGVEGVVPVTNAVFSNITIIGPYRGNTSNTIDAKFRRAVRLRRNSFLNIFNSYFADFPTGVHFDGAVTQNNLLNDSSFFRTNLIAGYLTGQAAQTPIGSTSGTPNNVYTKLFDGMLNDTSNSTSGILTSPYNYTAGDYRPATSSALRSGYDFTHPKFDDLIELGGALPDAATAINGPRCVAGTASQTYTTPVVGGADSYFWTVPTGVKVVSGQNTSTVVLQFTAASGSFNITVTPRNANGDGSSITTTVQKLASFTAPAVVSGSLDPCAGIGAGNSILYRVTTPATTTANGYLWEIPAGATILTGGNGFDSARISFPDSFLTGIINVRAFGVCASGDTIFSTVRKLTLKTILPGAPAAFTSTSSFNSDPCEGIGGSNSITYYFGTAPGATPNNSTSVEWVIPAGATVISGGGANDNFVQLRFDEGFLGGTLSARAVRQCGGTAFKSKFTSLKLKTRIPPAPLPLQLTDNSAAGADPCEYLGGTVIYQVDSANLASGYIWTVLTANPAGSLTLIGRSNLASPAKSRATFAFGEDFLTGTISVTAYRLCGTDTFFSKPRSLKLKTGFPLAPSILNTTLTGTDICGAVGTGSGDTVRYSVAEVTNATTWDWDVPAGANVISGGDGFSHLTLNFTNGYGSGVIGVRTGRACGTTTIYTKKLVRTLRPLLPSKPVLSGSANPCNAGETITYTITNPIANYTSIEWIVTFTGATIISGGGPTDLSVTVQFPAVAPNTAGTVSARTLRSCGTFSYASALTVRSIKAVASTCPGPVANLRENTEESRVANLKAGSDVYPNPSVGAFNLKVVSKSRAAGVAKVEVVNMFGQIVSEYNVATGNGTINMTLNENKLLNGNYFVRTTINGEVFTSKLMIKK